MGHIRFRHTKTTRGVSSRLSKQPVFLRESSGSTRYSVRPFVFSAVVVLRLSATGESGGDEETRTPDPLLAKEMLFQLSYVPLPLQSVELECWWAFLDSNQRPLP